MQQRPRQRPVQDLDQTKYYKSKLSVWMTSASDPTTYLGYKEALVTPCTCQVLLVAGLEVCLHFLLCLEVTVSRFFCLHNSQVEQDEETEFTHVEERSNLDNYFQIFDSMDAWVHMLSFEIIIFPYPFNLRSCLKKTYKSSYVIWFLPETDGWEANESTHHSDACQVTESHLWPMWGDTKDRQNKHSEHQTYPRVTTPLPSPTA